MMSIGLHGLLQINLRTRHYVDLALRVDLPARVGVDYLGLSREERVDPYTNLSHSLYIYIYIYMVCSQYFT